MSQVSDIARQVLSDVSSDAGHILASTWVARRYEEAMSKYRPRQLRRLGEVIAPATITTGTVTVTQGSTTVTPDADALAAWALIAQDGLIGRSFKGQDQTWYEIAQFTNSVIILKSPYILATAAGIGYAIAAQKVALAPDARWLGRFVLQRLWRPLLTVSLDELDGTAPGRVWDQGTPSAVAEIGVAPVAGVGDVRLVTFYPYPKVDELIHYVYWAFPLTLNFDDEVPRVIPDYTLREGALIDAMRYKMAKAIDAGALEAAALYRNEYRAQETLWKAKLADAARGDRGVDDVSFILSSYGGVGGQPGVDIRTAHDEVWARWGGS